MQWLNKIQFQGQVKTAGLEKSMQWKTGSVSFDYDAGSDTWKVKLFFKVNPNRASLEIMIKKSVTLSLKCGRLIVDDKNGNGIHIKLTGNDTATARALISQIQKSEPATQNHNKAEVGITPKSSALCRKGCENVTPSEHSSLLLSSSDRLLNKTPKHSISPVQNQPAKTSASDKSSHRQNVPEGGIRNGLSSWDEGMEEETTPGKFTGMKDISKKPEPSSRSKKERIRASPMHNGPVVTSGLGTKRFYGSLGTQTSDHSSQRLGNGLAHSLPTDQSPRLKRTKLTPDTEGYKSPSSLTLAGNQSRCKMTAIRVPDTPGQSDSPQKDVPKQTSESVHVQTSEAEHNQTSEASGCSESTVGFDNLGNTCFMNSPLQCLSSLEPLSIDFQTAVLEYGSELRPSSVTRLLYLLMKDVRKQNVCPNRVRQILERLRDDINVKFAFNTQQDAHELLAELLDRTDEEMKSVMRARDPHLSAGDASSSGAASASKSVFTSSGTPIETNFMWFYKTSFFFHECKTEVTAQQEERDTTLMLALDSDKDSSLQDCIDRYFESSEVDMRCEKCGKEEKATMTRKIVRRPRIFILNLLRYQTDNAESKKKMDSVGISSYMSVAEYCAEDVKAPPYMEPVFMLDREEFINSSKRGSSNTSSRSHVSSDQRKVPKTLPISRKTRILNSLRDKSPSDSPFECVGPPVIVVVNPPLKSFKEAFFDTSPPPSPSEVEVMSKCVAEKLKESPDSSPVSKTLASINASEETLDAWELVMLSDNPFSQQPTGHEENDQEAPVQASTPTSEVPDLVEMSPFSFAASLDENHPCLQHMLSPSPSPPGRSRAGIPPFDVTVGANRLRSVSKNEQTSAPLPDLAQPEQKCLVSGNNDPEAKIKLDEQTKEQKGQPQTKKVTITEPDKTVVSDPDVKLLAQSLVEKFWEVERCIHEFSGVNMDGLYAETRAIISETNAFVEQMKQDILGVNGDDVKPASSDQSGGYPQENRMAICDRLMNKALLDGDDNNPDKIETFLDDADCSLICDEVLVIRYGSYAKEEQKINHFIEDLGLYLAAKNLGIVKPDSPRERQSRDQNNWDAVELPDIQVESSFAEARGGEHSDEEVTFKRNSSGSKHGQGTDSSSSWQDDRYLSADKKMDCGTVTASAPCSGANFPQKEHQYFSPDVPSSLLQGKDISLYSEQDLQQVDVNSLTEDEMLLYAQALSRYEYMKETKAQVQEDDMDLCDADDRPNADSVSEASPSSLSTEGIKAGHMSDSGQKIASSTSMGVSPKSKHCTSSKRQSASPKSLKLACDEDLGELDDIKTKREAQQSQSRWSRNRSSSRPEYHWSELEPSIPKICDFCSKEYEDECISCSVLNQPGLDSSMMAFSESDSYPCNQTSNNKPKASGKCNTSPDNNKILKPLNDTDSDMQPCAGKSPTDEIHMSSPEVLKQAENSGDHVVPTCSSQPNPRKEKYLFSPSKPNNLTKSRDYSRLRSPSASPRKKNKTSRSSSASKRLLFPADERGDKNDSLSYLDDGQDTSQELDTSLEVNIGESSFDTREESLMTPACSSRSSQSPAGPAFSPLAKHSLNAPTSVITPPKFSASGKRGSHPSDTAHSSSQVLQANQSQIDPHAREPRVSSSNSRNEQCSSKERFQENKSERMQALGKSRSSWSSVSSNTEEKENDPADQARSKRLENIEVGKADFSYRLVGIVNHIGESLYAGHYTAFAYNLSKQKWFFMDDKHTKEASEAIAKRDSLQSGYVFFYMDKDLFHEYAAKVEEASTKK